MSSLTRKPPSLNIYLRLGRVSNLPTVWTNVLAGTVLGGGSAAVLQPRTLVVGAAISAFYVAGMYLNDAFDRVIDARERPGRPIPSGDISALTVFGIGFTLLALGLIGLMLCGTGGALAGVLLALAIVVYDIWHKGNPCSPLIMGLCRMLVYLTAALVAGGSSDAIGAALALAAVAVLAHIAGLTYAAKQEALDRVGRYWPLALLALPIGLYGLVAPGLASLALLVPMAALALTDLAAVRQLMRRQAGDVPKAVAQLIAATSLLDAMVIAAAGADLALLIACFAAYACTRLLQRVIPGT
jgi:4-hydroxybenzoate polyprenyltransferase